MGFEKGKKNIKYIDGRNSILSYCIDCKVLLSSSRYKRCKKCNGLYNNAMQDKKGKLNPNYKHGGKTKCLDCEKTINYPYSRCKSCAAKNLWSLKEYKDSRTMKGINNPMFGKKHTKESKSKMSIKAGGSGIPGDYGDYGFEFNEELKKQIRKRDNYTCQNCLITEEEHIMVFGRKLSIHHIDYDKQNNFENNLISLCCSCHSRTNHNRDYWRKRYE